jgi:hypothetical protein
MVYNMTGRTVITKNNTANRRPHLNHHLLNKGDFTLFLFGHHMKLGALSLTEGFPLQPSTDRIP